MREERIELSQGERDRFEGTPPRRAGLSDPGGSGPAGAVSARQVRRLLRRVRAEGDRGLVQRLRGRPSNRKLPAALQGRILAGWLRRWVRPAGARYR